MIPYALIQYDNPSASNKTFTQYIDKYIFLNLTKQTLMSGYALLPAYFIALLPEIIFFNFLAFLSFLTLASALI